MKTRRQKLLFALARQFGKVTEGKKTTKVDDCYFGWWNITQLFSIRLRLAGESHVGITGERLARGQSKRTDSPVGGCDVDDAVRKIRQIILHNSHPQASQICHTADHRRGRGVGGSLGGAALPVPRPRLLPGERHPETCIVYKTNGSCAGQIVLLKRALFVTLDGEQNFNIKRGNNLYVSQIYVSLDGALPP